MGFAHSGNAAIVDMFKRTLTEIEPSDFFFVYVKAKDAKFLCRGCEHQRQANIAHADDANLRTAIFDARAQSLVIYFGLHFSSFIQ